MLNAAFPATCEKIDAFASTFLHQLLLNIFQNAVWVFSSSLQCYYQTGWGAIFSLLGFLWLTNWELDLRNLQLGTMSRAQILSGVYYFVTFCLFFQLLCKDGL